MVYQGSKNRLAKFIVPILQDCIDKNNCTTFIDLFCGGCNIVDKIRCENRIANDSNEDLILLLKYVQSDNLITIAPDDCSFDHYVDVRNDRNHEKYSQVYRALIGYMASYGGRYFDGGYGRDSKGGRCIYKERLENFKAQAPLLNKIKFLCNDYKKLNLDKIKNAVIYCDPPYINTKKYGNQVINYDEFYEFCRRAAQNNYVFVSEYQMPGDFTCIWQKERKVLQKSDRTIGDMAIEKLFTI